MDSNRLNSPQFLPQPGLVLRLLIVGIEPLFQMKLESAGGQHPS
jgi:hypothetical protein